MTSIRTYLGSVTRTTRTILVGLAVVFVSAGIAQAATTISTNISTEGTLAATGLSTLTGGFVSQASSTVVGAFTATGAATLASTTVTSMKVSQVGTRVTRIVAGYCVTASIAIPATNGSSTQTYANCTPSEGTSVITSGDRVFVQATSSLPHYIVVQSASSTASGGLITVGLTNFSTTTSPAAAIYAFNFWAFQ